MMSLTNDTARCSGMQCPSAHNCRRYTENASISDADLLRAATAELMKPGRMFLTIFGKDTTGQPHPITYPVSEGARMLTDDEIIQRISKADGFPAPMLPALISAAASRLQARSS